MRPRGRIGGRRAPVIVVYAFTAFLFVYLVYALLNPEKF
ncbi:K(+)-transporting ATPase subunit F [Paenibacillus hodogayensis]|uniref:K(+)-transporting ATPase subunit F n=1 Tax=Paenibacillus hodogayensis TaxID=279208 RepID=A0ABV5W8N1_9BACL